MFTQPPKKLEASDCFNCTAAKRHCDRTRHRCNKCLQESDICTGYARKLQWLPGVKSRGRNKDQPFSIPRSSRLSRSAETTNHDFIFKQGRVRRRRRVGAAVPVGPPAMSHFVQPPSVATEYEEPVSSQQQLVEAELVSTLNEGMQDCVPYFAFSHFDDFDEFDNSAINLLCAEDPTSQWPALISPLGVTTPSPVSSSRPVVQSATVNLSPIPSLAGPLSLDSSELLRFCELLLNSSMSARSRIANFSRRRATLYTTADLRLL